MLATLRPWVVMLGVAGGGLLTTLLALLVWPLMELLPVSAPPFLALLLGMVGGMLGAGWLTGRMVGRAGAQFHGSVTGLGLAGLTIVITLLGGGSASLPSVLTLILLGLILGRIGAWWAGKTTPPRSKNSYSQDID